MPATEIRRALLLLAAGGFVSGLSIRLAEPLLPKVAHDFGTSVAAASVLITGFTLAYGLFQLVHGPLGDRIGKLRAVVGSLVLAAVMSAACAFAPSLEWLAGFRFLTGMTAGAVVPLSFAFIGDNVPYERRQMVLAQYISGVLLGQTFGPLLGGIFSDSIGWRATVLVPACAFLAIGALLSRDARTIVQTTHPDVSFNPFTRLASLLHARRARIVLVAAAIEGFLFFGAFAYLGAYLRHDFDLSYTAIGLVLAGFGLGGVAYSLLVRSLVRRLGQRGLVAGGGGVLLACFLIVALAPAWAMVVPCIFLLGLGYDMLHNTLQTHATEMAPEARGSAVAFFAFCFFLGQAAGVSALGFAAEWTGYRGVFAAAGIGLALLGAWFGRELRRL
jgi:predicted MFS family arabinose efflux permease